MEGKGGEEMNNKTYKNKIKKGQIWIDEYQICLCMLLMRIEMVVAKQR